MQKNRKEIQRKRVHFRVRKKITGTPERPRLCVFKSDKHIYAQIIDDSRGVTLSAASTLSAELRELLNGLKGMEKAEKVGELLAKKAVESGIDKVVFDRGGFKYHGKIKSLADGARNNGLTF